ncbi:MAG TPA: hypothetical protein VGA53_05155 [Candidatus Paceibacterota bacterium]
MTTAYLRVEAQGEDISQILLAIKASGNGLVESLETGSWRHEVRGIVYNIKGTVQGTVVQLANFLRELAGISGVRWFETLFEL